jgi:tetratricopeptide (TPR) repeat protein
LRAWLLQATLAAARAREGTTDEVATHLNSNAASAANAFGEHEEALKYYQNALTIQRNRLGEQHPSTAGTYNNMANVFDKQGRLEKAMELY